MGSINPFEKIQPQNFRENNPEKKEKDFSQLLPTKRQWESPEWKLSAGRGTERINQLANDLFDYLKENDQDLADLALSETEPRNEREQIIEQLEEYLRESLGKLWDNDYPHFTADTLIQELKGIIDPEKGKIDQVGVKEKWWREGLA